MTSGLPGLEKSAVQHRLAAPEFFYNNLRIQETLTTIRYGIEARKGLTIVTGAPGVGKSTLLRKAATDLPANIICIFESDPRVSFSDILRLLLHNLGDDHLSDEEESSMVRSCRLELRSRLDRGQIVALFLDNAHQFPDQTLCLIAQNFLAGSADDSRETLIQLILAGGPQLKTKISQATLTFVRRRSAIVCELQPLNSGEIASFIEKGLKTSNRPADMFDERAIKRIALYTNGNLGAVNSICQRALQLASGSTDAHITTELIERAASDLDLRQFCQTPDSKMFGLPSNALEFDAPKPPERFDDKTDIPYNFSPAEDASNAPIFPPNAGAVDNVTGRPRSKRGTAWARRLTILGIVVLCSVAMIRTDAALNLLSGWWAKLSQMAAPYLQSAAKTKIPAEIKIIPQRPASAEPLVPLPGPDRPAEIREDITALGIASTANQEHRPSTKANSGQQNHDLQIQITKAIENRAIMGIEVSVVQGTAYLDGQVATERQRTAAERAARSVVGVERVRNRIAITVG